LLYYIRPHSGILNVGALAPALSRNQTKAFMEMDAGSRIEGALFHCQCTGSSLRR